MIRKARNDKKLIEIGWREWVSLPNFNIPVIKAKIDTGARTSAIHAIDISTYEENSIPMVSFLIRPIQKNNHENVHCTARVIDQRIITDSGGHREKRIIISTLLGIGKRTWPVELSLANRSTMTFRLILGRTALKKRCIIDPSRSFINTNQG